MKIDGTIGALFTTTLTSLEVLEQPLASETVTETVALDEMVTLFDVAPVVHRLPDEAEDVKVTELPSQNVLGPFKLITGVGGFAFTVTTTGEETAVHPCAFVCETV